MVSRISTSLTAQLVSILASESLDTERLCKESGIDIEELSSQSKFISRSSFLQLMDLAEIESSNPNIGLKAHHQLLPGAFQLVGYAMISSATLKDALLALVRFSTLLGNGFTIKLTQEKSGMRLWHSDNSEGKAKKSRAFSDVILSSTMGLCRRMTGGRRPIGGPTLEAFTYNRPTGRGALGLSDAGVVAIGFVTDDLGAMLSRVLAAGGSIISRDDRGAVAQDIYGNLIQFRQSAQGQQL